MTWVTVTAIEEDKRVLEEGGARAEESERCLLATNSVDSGSPVATVEVEWTHDLHENCAKLEPVAIGATGDEATQKKTSSGQEVVRLSYTLITCFVARTTTSAVSPHIHVQIHHQDVRPLVTTENNNANRIVSGSMPENSHKCH